MISQRDKNWAGEIMGGGNFVIGKVGCYLTALCQGLVDKGYDFTPHTLNQELKTRGLWDQNSYIDVAQITTKWPEVFTSFTSIDPYNDIPSIDTLVSDTTIVLCRVNAAGIGGTGTHFVLLKDVKNGVAVVGDPWFGSEDLITRRYGGFGNILGLRIFGVKKKDSGIINSQPQMMNDQTKYDFGEGIGSQELGAIKSIIHDLRNASARDQLSISNLQNDLKNEADANQAQANAFKSDLGEIAAALGSTITPDKPSIIGAIARLSGQADQLDNSQRLTKAVVAGASDPRVNIFDTVLNWFRGW